MRSNDRRLGRPSILGVVCAVFVLAGCEGVSQEPASVARATSGDVAVAVAAVDEGPACQGSAAHDAHASAGCVACHPCGGNTQISETVTLSNGRTLPGGSIEVTASGTTCYVACHNPGGAPSTTGISWTAGGPLACTSCHPAAARTGLSLSAHVEPGATVVAERSSCSACHELGNHMSGVIRVAGADGPVDVPAGDLAAVSPVCVACHDGDGRSLTNKTPPYLPGWTSATGDFHGARVGTGFGGTLRFPYERGQGALACGECHDSHSSENAFLFRASVNGTVVNGGLIDRAGVGGEALCEACHEGPRHQYCQGCHGVDPAGPGSACFYCHGHEGIRNIVVPYGFHKTGTGCAHCHEPGWYKPLDYMAPTISGVVVANVTTSSFTLMWTTSEPATSLVEYGVGTDLGRTAGTAELKTTHSVTLNGLAAGTTYGARVRAVDGFRNVTVGPLLSVQTVDPLAIAAPAIFPEPEFCYEWGVPITARLQWQPSAPVAGGAVTYRLQLARSATFASPLLLETDWIPGTFQDVVLPNYGVWYYWRVQAKEGTRTSTWSVTDQFAPVDCDAW